MTKVRILALACCAVSATAFAAGNPFDALKGKIKVGMYAYKMDIDMGAMPGLPPGVAKQSRTFQRCVTQQDVDKGEMGRGPDRDGKAPECEIKNFSHSGNTASYTIVCKEMTADNKLTFSSDGFVMDMKMAVDDDGEKMKMTQHIEGKYLGPCK